MTSPTFWQRAKDNGKVGFDKVYGWVDKLGPPVNRLSNKMGSEAFWPTTLDKESDKCARILKSFCKDGFYQEEEVQPLDGPKQKQKVLKKIPIEVIKNAKGLAIFTTMRTGLWISGSGGSGVLIARKPDGSWSPPSGIMIQTMGLGFLAGVDIYDCVTVINTQKALDAFSKLRCTLGTEVSAVAGPLGIGGQLEANLRQMQAPVFTYIKSRGLYAGVQLEGAVVIERTDENERFYLSRVPVADILAGKVRPPFETRKLLATVRSAQGDTDIDETQLPSEPAPADFEIEATEQVFGVPDKEDPDPFGVLALEKAGLEIREAGTRARVSSDNFNFAPSPRSPIFDTFNRRSIDTHSMRGYSHSRRASHASNAERVTSMSDMSTQTDRDGPSVSRPMSAMSGTRLNGNRDSTQSTIQSRIVEQPEPQDEVQSPKPASPTPSLEINGVKTEHTDGFEDVPLTNGAASRNTPPALPPRPVNSASPSRATAESPEPTSKTTVSIMTDTENTIELQQPPKPQPKAQDGFVAEPTETIFTTESPTVSEAAPEAKPEAHPEAHPEAKPEAKSEAKSHEISAEDSKDAVIAVDTPQSPKSTNGTISKSNRQSIYEDHFASDIDDDFSDSDLEIIDSTPVVVQQLQPLPATAAAAATASTVPRARVVMVNKPAPPPQLPPRSARRARFPDSISVTTSERSSMDRTFGSSVDQGTDMTPMSETPPTVGDAEIAKPEERVTSIGSSIAKLRVESDDEDGDSPREVEDGFHGARNERRQESERANASATTTTTTPASV